MIQNSMSQKKKIQTTSQITEELTWESLMTTESHMEKDSYLLRIADITKELFWMAKLMDSVFLHRQMEGSNMVSWSLANGVVK